MAIKVKGLRDHLNFIKKGQETILTNKLALSLIERGYAEFIVFIQKGSKHETASSVLDNAEFLDKYGIKYKRYYAPSEVVTIIKKLESTKKSK